MKRFSFQLILSAAATVAASGGSVLAVDDATAEELKILKERIAQLESRQATADRALVDKSIADVLADADRRSQLLAAGGGVTAGYDKGFFIQSEDKNFVLRPSVIAQFRGVASTADDAQADGDRDAQTGFELRRVRLRFDGNVISPNLTYNFVWDTNRQGGGVTLLDAWAAYRFAPEWAIKGGQFKESWTHEKDVPLTGLLAVDRTLVDTLIGGNLTDRVQGVALMYGGTKNNPIRAEASFHDGANSKNTDFRDEIPAGAGTVLNPANFGLGGRVEYKLFGDWADYRDFTAKGTKTDLLVFGAGVEFTQRGDSDTTLATLDAQYETNTGFNAYAGVVGNFIGNAAGADRSDFGFVVQGGYLVAPAWEAFGRYDVVFLDSDFVAGEDTFHEFTVGVNYFLGDNGSALHRAKITADVSYLPNGSPSTQTGIGALSGDNSQFILRAQFQLQL